MIKLFEMFAGYGGASFALKRAGTPFVCVGYSEIKKSAIACYEKNHPGVKNYGDCTKIVPEELPDFDLLTGGFPCQTFSMAGKREGFKDARGNLFLEICRIANVKKPRYMLLENVEGLLNHDNGNTLSTIINSLWSIGYSVVLKVLDSSEHGIPQTRRRLWFCCRREQWGFNEMKWPNKTGCCKVKELLESDVDKKYYLNDDRIKKIMNWKSNRNPLNNISNCQGAVSTLTARGQDNHAGMQLIMDTLTANCGHGGSMKVIEENKARFCDDISPTLVCGRCHTHFPTPLFLNNGTKAGFQAAFEGDGVTLSYPQSKTKRGRVKTQKSPTIDASVPPGVVEKNTIRRLTPKECFRLMGFTNDEIDISMLSENQAYNLAGDGWEINVASLVLKSMLKFNQPL